MVCQPPPIRSGAGVRDGPPPPPWTIGPKAVPKTCGTMMERS